jgi:hypothetical protein
MCRNALCLMRSESEAPTLEPVRFSRHLGPTRAEAQRLTGSIASVGLSWRVGFTPDSGRILRRSEPTVRVEILCRRGGQGDTVSV